MSSSPIRIARLDTSHFEDLRALHHEAFPVPWSDALLQDELQASPDRVGLGAYCNSSLVGYVLARRLVDEVHIVSIATAPSLHRQGIATMLMDSLRTEPQVAECERLLLEVRESNRAAIEFYLHEGFELLGKRPGYYADNGESALVLSRRLFAEDTDSP
ncbi:MAG: ribosomal protein S18-alanine N-acetyltransferase [Bdellovibrionales bacterium]|nr:ribosomal protein S18-alanine N-acetyltransferase [Bdellovibrionales bacterium]